MKNKILSLKRLLWLLLIATLLTAVVLFFTQYRMGPADEKKAYVLRVIDGDTFLIRYCGKEEKLRLIGIDTPETRANRKASKDADRSDHDLRTIMAMGDEARAYVQLIVPRGTEIALEFDVQQRDQYGRLLAYVYLQNGEMLNEKIIADGYARPMTYPPNIKYQQLFVVQYQKARYEKKGLWKSPEEK